MATAKYSQEFKLQALEMVRTEGVSKTSKAMGVSVPTLYSWKKGTTPPDIEASALDGTAGGEQAIQEADGQAQESARPAEPKTNAKSKAPAARRAAVNKARAILAEDGKNSLKKENQQLRAENQQLREKVETLKTLLLTLIDA